MADRVVERLVVAEVIFSRVVKQVRLAAEQMVASHRLPPPRMLVSPRVTPANAPEPLSEPDAVAVLSPVPTLGGSGPWTKTNL
jgi:hypothetical protein